MRRILQELRREIEHITDEAPAGPGELDPRRLGDRDLERLGALLPRAESDLKRLAREESTEPRRLVRPREEFLAGKPNPETWRRHWAQNPGADPPPEDAYVGRLSDEEWAELEALLKKARVPEPWEGDERHVPGEKLPQ